MALRRIRQVKPYGFPVHGCINGWSRKVLWLKITRSNNSPDAIASFYLECVRHQNGCPVRLITDKGTENGTAAKIQCFFRDSLEAHKYVTSTHNQSTNQQERREGGSQGNYLGAQAPPGESWGPRSQSVVEASDNTRLIHD